MLFLGRFSRIWYNLQWQWPPPRDISWHWFVSCSKGFNLIMHFDEISLVINECWCELQYTKVHKISLKMLNLVHFAQQLCMVWIQTCFINPCWNYFWTFQLPLTRVSQMSLSMRSDYTRWPQKNITVDFSVLCSHQQLSFFTLLDRASFPHYNNTKIIKFGWELFILWVISYGLSFSGIARFPDVRGTIIDKSMANPENDSP